jgi:hypothetical protein
MALVQSFLSAFATLRSGPITQPVRTHETTREMLKCDIREYYEELSNHISFNLDRTILMIALQEHLRAFLHVTR